MLNGKYPPPPPPTKISICPYSNKWLVTLCMLFTLNGIWYLRHYVLNHRGLADIHGSIKQIHHKCLEFLSLAAPPCNWAKLGVISFIVEGDSETCFDYL